MTKQEFIRKVQAGCDGAITRAMIEDVLSSVAATVAVAVVQGDKVTIPDVCTISVKERAARTGRNPQTGESMILPAGKRVAITPVASLKNILKIDTK